MAPAAGATAPTLAELRAWAAERLPHYELPRRRAVLQALPRNAMGKINKKQLREHVFGGVADGGSAEGGCGNGGADGTGGTRAAAAPAG